MEQEKPIVTAEIYDEYSVEFPDLKVGEELPQEIIDLEAEKVKVAHEKAAAEEEEKQDDEAQATLNEGASDARGEDAQLTYRGLKVISNGHRTVGEQTFHHIKCEDGTSYDLSEDDYSKEVKSI